MPNGRTLPRIIAILRIRRIFSNALAVGFLFSFVSACLASSSDTSPVCGFFWEDFIILPIASMENVPRRRYSRNSLPITIRCPRQFSSPRLTISRSASETPIRSITATSASRTAFSRISGCIRYLFSIPAT